MPATEVEVPTVVSHGTTEMSGSADNLPSAGDGDLAALMAQAGVPHLPDNTGDAQPAKPAAPATKPAASTVPDAEDETPAPPDNEPEDPITASIVAATRKPGRPAQNRDFSGLNDEEKEIFSKMGNKAYEKLRPLYDAYKKHGDFDQLNEKLTKTEQRALEAEKQRWRDHPEAYKLSDEYNQANELLGSARAVADHWQQQLAAIDSGAKEITVLGFDQKGNIIGQKVPVTPATRADLTRRQMQSLTDIAEAEKVVSDIKSQHSSWWKQHDSALEDLFTKYYKPHSEALKPYLDKLNFFPQRFANSLEGRLTIHALAANMSMMQQLAAKRAEGQITAARSATTKSSGPTQADIKQNSPTKPGAKSATVSDAEFEAFLREYKT